jgi:uncharacterized protein HemX
MADISYLLAVVETTTEGGGGPDLTGIAAIITATVGIVGFLATLLRGKKNNQRVEEVESAAHYIEGFDALIKRLQDEIQDLHGEIDANEAKWQGEKEQIRRQWTAEKEALLTTIRELRTDLQEQIAANNVLRSELIELRGQIKGFLTKTQYDEFAKHL